LGLSDPERDLKTESGLVYDLASVSKVVGVGTVLTFLWQQGTFDMERPVTDFLPECDYPDITIRHLLTHATALDPFIHNRDKLRA
ncbi:beta-lactamase family protein, partial [Streptococcus gordonii]|uniref:serine hydrolase n=1 Tax=Streptococcus gordonii TaxID=1302 RepID=UPI0022833517